jgi:hypothetical protein
VAHESERPRSGWVQPSLNDRQDNWGGRLGQQPQSVPKITLDGAMAVANIGSAHACFPAPVALVQNEDKLTELCAAISAHLSGSVPEAAVHEPLRAFTVEARSRNTRAEQVVITLKRAWESLHDVRQAWPRETQLRFLDRLVTRCIAEYYSGQPEAPDQPGGSRGLVR